MPIEALILAEGGAGRLRPLTEHVPTSVLPVGGTSILDHQIQVLRSMAVGSVTVIGGYRGAQVEQICRAYADVRFCLNPRFNREEPYLDAVRLAGLVPRAPLLVLRGDLLFDSELIRLVTSTAARDCAVVDDERQALGLWRLSVEAVKDLLDMSAESTAPEQPLHAALDRLLSREGAESVSPNGHPWVLIDSLESLARALRVERQIAETRVARTTARLDQVGAARRSPPLSLLPPGDSGKIPLPTTFSKHAA